MPVIWTPYIVSCVPLLLSRSSDDMRAGTQDQDLEELDTISDERNGLLNGPVPDMDTLEIGITRKEMGELLNCMNYSNIFISPSTHSFYHSFKVLSKFTLHVLCTARFTLYWSVVKGSTV